MVSAGWVPASDIGGSRVFGGVDGWVARVACVVYVCVIVYIDVCMRAYVLRDLHDRVNVVIRASYVPAQERHSTTNP